MNNRKVFEDSLLQAMDGIAEQSKDNTMKMLVDLLKSAILKPYKGAYYQELAQGKVHKENVEKAVDFYFSDMCVSFRTIQNLTPEVKDREINALTRELEVLRKKVRCYEEIDKCVKYLSNVNSNKKLPKRKKER